MKCVILAAGKGTRMGDLSVVTPKPMLKVLGKTLLEHKLEMLPDSIDEVIIVVGHLKNSVTDFFGNSYKNKKISYVVQENLNGTAGALFLCKELLKDEERFLVIMGDDIYSREDTDEAIKNDFSIGVKRSESVKGKAKVIFDKKENIKNILEKYEFDEPGYVCTGMYSLTPKIFDYEMVKIPNGEYGLPQTILSAKKDVAIKAIQSKVWIQITSPEDLKTAEKFLSK